jgi:hypothetical protein
MAILTIDRAGNYAASSHGKGLLRRAMDRYIDAQIRKAERYVNAYLQHFDDSALSNLGYSPAEIKRVRQSGAYVPMID